MNDLGMMLAWVAVQVSLLAVPCLAAHALASRRGPSSGAWVAAVSLGLVVTLNVRGIFSTAGWGEPPAGRPALHPSTHATGGPSAARGKPPRSSTRHGPRLAVDFAAVSLAWSRVGRRAAVPAERCRPWGGVLTAAALGGSTLCLLRLVTGLLAVRACRRRSRAVDDPGATRLLGELKRAMGCNRPVEIREAADLPSPATAGWLRPVLLLPRDWRCWDEPERRAVFAHELGHVVRGDYAVGLLTRVALALNYYHPLVHWIAGRLQLQQEQAADALGARFAGGREAYLVSLSRLALKQDGRPPHWPARAFLPARGALIRRIAMLNDRDGWGPPERPAAAWRALTACALLAATAGVAALRGPARAGDAPAAEGGAPQPAGPRLDPPYVPEGADGVLVVRPAAISRRAGKGVAGLLLSDAVGVDVAGLAKQFNVDAARPGFLSLGWEDVESVACGLAFGRKADAGKGELRTVMFSGLVVRTAKAFDWPAFLRQWRLDLVEARAGGRAYFKIEGALKEALGPDPCVYLPDDRTVVFDREEPIRALAGGKAPPLPAYLRGKDWGRASRGLLAVAVDNRGGALAKKYDLGRPDDAVALSLLEGVDHWVFGVDDADAVGLRAVAACLGDDAGGKIVGVIRPLLGTAREAVERPGAAAAGAVQRAAAALLENLTVRNAGREVVIRSEGFGTLAELASIAESEAKKARPRQEGEEAEVRRR